jgi:hypothetical protein
MGSDLTQAEVTDCGTGRSDDTAAPARSGIPARMARAPRIVALACAVAALAGTAGCSVAAENAADSTNASGSPTPAAQSSSASASTSSSDPGCVTAIKAVSTYGPVTIQDAAAAKKAVDKAEIEILVVALDLAADAATDPQAKHSIQSLANAYLSFQDAWTNLAAPPLSTVLADTSALQGICG